MKSAEHPFQFVTASYLTHITNHRANNLCELRKGIQTGSDPSIFYHTFQSLDRLHFLAEGFSNDFAQWVLASCNRPTLAERLAGIDIRDYLSLSDLRAELARLIGEYCEGSSGNSVQPAFEPFYFCEAVEVIVPLGLEARNLEEFRSALEKLAHTSIYFHFISSRLRLHLRTNDFSHWLANDLGLESLANRVNRIDIYTNTLEGVRAKLIALVAQEISK